MKICIIKILFFALVLSTGSVTVLAQKDTAITRQGDMLVGDIESFSKGILFLKTPYARDAIALKWSELTFIKSTKQFKLFDKKGHLMFGEIRMDTADHNNFIVTTKDSVIYIKREQIGQISKYDIQRLRDRLTLHADIGYVLTKANNTRQASIGFGAGFEAKRWDFTFDFLSYASRVDTIVNNSGNIGLSIKFLLPANWFFYGRTNLFTSSEQQIDYRFANLLGLGKYLVRRDKNLLYLNVGGTFNNEKYTSSSTDFKSTELFGSMHSELYLFKGIDFLLDLVVFPSLTESGRVRSYVATEIKFNFVRHFNFGLNYRLTTDNKPPVTSSNSDYILNFKLGWKL